MRKRWNSRRTIITSITSTVAVAIAASGDTNSASHVYSTASQRSSPSHSPAAIGSNASARAQTVHCSRPSHWSRTVSRTPRAAHGFMDHPRVQSPEGRPKLAN
eukprot:6215368-Prymnesium_polylepis.3